MKSLKIGFFIPFFPLVKGGAEYQSKIIATELRRLGHNVFFISEGFQQNEVIYKDDFKIYGITVSSSYQEKISLYKGFSKLFEEIIVKERPDILYQRILNTFSFRISKVTESLSIPFVLHIADNYSIEFTGFKGIFKKVLFKEIVKNNSALICQTDYQLMKISDFICDNSVIKVPNMHPIIMTEIKRKRIKEILWIGNARPVKQLELFINLAQKFKKTDYLFKVIGNLPKTDYGKELQKRINRSDNVKYYGEKENGFINNELSEVGLLVNTSVSEGFSNTFIQAWMNGTPVLSLNSDPDGVMEQHKIGINCSGDISRLSTELEWLLYSDDYLEICENALRVSNELFSLKSNVKAIENLFIDIVNAHK